MSLLRLAPLAALASSLFAGCAAPRSGARSDVPPLADTERPAYRIWNTGSLWHLRAASGPRHRFQGSVEGMTGGLLEVHTFPPTRADLVDRVGLARNSIQFDFDVENGEAGFDTAVSGGCLRFDLFVDGHRHPARVHFGPDLDTPRSLPVVSCP